MVKLQRFCSQIDLSLLAILTKPGHAIATPITLLPFQQTAMTCSKNPRSTLDLHHNPPFHD